MFKILKNWVLELDPTEKYDKDNYSSTPKGYSSEIYAKTEDGEYVEVVYIPLVLTESDSKEIESMEDAKEKALELYWKKYNGGLFAPRDKDNKEWEAIWEKYDDAIVYKKRRSKELHDAHLFLVLASPYMFDILDKYSKTGNIDKRELKTVMDIVSGKNPPFIERLPRYKQE